MGIFQAFRKYCQKVSRMRWATELDAHERNSYERKASGLRRADEIRQAAARANRCSTLPDGRGPAPVGAEQTTTFALRRLYAGQE